MANEQEFIHRLQNRFGEHLPPDIPVGIGDDGAVLDVSSHPRQVVVTDMLLDGVHFDLQSTSPRLAGRKAVAVNLSDLAAMACKPVAGFVSIAVPQKLTAQDDFLAELYDGIAEISESFGVTIAGGDTNSWNGPFAINVCLTGHPYLAEPILRSTARPGDRLFVTGPLGGSLQRDRHLLFEPRVKLSERIVQHLRVTAMMDISDGLALDLSRMMTASRCGAIINAAAIPINEDVSSRESTKARLQHALSDGEDFELLIAVNPQNTTELKAAVTDGKLIEVGVVTDSESLLMRDEDGSTAPLAADGFQHL